MKLFCFDYSGSVHELKSNACFNNALPEQRFVKVPGVSSVLMVTEKVAMCRFVQPMSHA